MESLEIAKLAKSIETIKRQGTREYYQLRKAGNPAFLGEFLELEGNGDVFCAEDSCFGIGFGIGNSVTVADLEEMENFVRKKRKNAALLLELTLFTEEQLLTKLQQAGYTLDHFLSVWAQDLEVYSLDPEDEKAPDIAVEKVGKENTQEWASAVALGISADGYASEDSIESVRAFLDVGGNTAFLVREKGECIAGGCLAISGTLGELFLTGTMRGYRRKGYQNLLIRERIRYAKAEGCTHLTVTTKPRTSSSRNAERNGFRLLYNKVVLKSPKLH